MPLTLSRGDQSVTIADNLPTVIIGERINPTGRKKLQAALLANDFSIVASEARAQTAAGAHMLDVNVGVAGGDEPRLIVEAMKVVMDNSPVPLCIDSANPIALEAALKIYPGVALVNSVTGEDDKLDIVLPLIAKYKAAVVCLCIGQEGIPSTAEGRLAVARKIAGRAAALGIPRENLVFDCLCLACSTDVSSVRTTLDAIRMVHSELGTNMTLGVSNVSFGLPERVKLNVAMLTMALANGVTCPIIDPTIAEVRQAILAADVLLGRDEWAMNWITAARAAAAAAKQA
jgi:5-methyltetrahydrofolate--homocysteine methyltransferase